MKKCRENFTGEEKCVYLKPVNTIYQGFYKEKGILKNIDYFLASKKEDRISFEIEFVITKSIISIRLLIEILL